MNRILFLTVFAILAAPALGQIDPDDKKTGRALLNDGMRAEQTNLSLALTKYKKAKAKAEKDGQKDVHAEALLRIAGCNERLVPENIAEAQAAYAEIVSNLADQEKAVADAKTKISYKGVDVWLKQLHASLDAWRVSTARSAQDPVVVEKKEAAWGKIKELKTEAVAGLIWGLGQADEVIRDFAGDRLAEVVDQAGVEAVVAKLNDPSPQMRAGASTALQKIYKKWNDAAALDRRADELERDINVPIPEGGRSGPSIGKLKDEATKLRAKADEIRAGSSGGPGIPKTLATEAIQGQLEKIVSDETAHVQARREAARAAANIGQISGPLVDALLKGMQSRESNVREACCRAGGAVNTANSTDKHKLADGLILSVRYEPAKAASEENKPPVVDDKGTPDWFNDEAVRQACAEALEQIGLVKSLPALIEALDDNDSRVRGAAFRALREITRKDFAYGKDEKTSEDKTYEADKPLAERKLGQAKWKEWWDQTAGIVVLVERFYRFQSEWREFNMAHLFDEESFLKDVESRKSYYPDPKAFEDRANRVVKNFQSLKNVFVQDAVDIGPSALPHLVKFLGGETELDKRPNTSTRLFVAEACAKIVDKAGGTGADQIRDKLAGGENAAQKAGGAAGLGFLAKATVGASERQALVQGLAGEPEVKEACANALGRVGEAANGAELARAATDTSKAVQLAALRAIARLKPKGVADVIPTLSDLVAHEPNPGEASKQSRDAQVREYAADALGAIEDSTGVPALLRARRDTTRTVRDAAALAIQKVYKAEADKSGAALKEVLYEEKAKQKSLDRIGAALGLGETASAKHAKDLADRLIDVNPPRILRDSDPGVRIALCQALGNLKLKNKSPIAALLNCLRDEGEAEEVRNSAYKALCAIFEKDPDKEGSPDAALKFRGSDPKAARLGAVGQWAQLIGDVSSLKDE